MDARIPDAVGIILVALGCYLAFGNEQSSYSSAMLFICGLAGFSLRRREHSCRIVRLLARCVFAYAPTAVILLAVVATLSDFGRHYTRTDFGMFYSTALQLRTDPAHLYDVNVQQQTLRAVTGDLENHYLSFPYPPFVAALFVPLTYLSFRNAYAVMVGVNLVLVTATVYLLCVSLCRTRGQKVTLILATSVLLPVYINLILGQMAFVGLLLYSAFAIDVLKGRETRAGIWAGLLSYKLMLVPIPLIFLLLRRAWRGLFVAIAIMSLLLGLSFLLVGVDGMLGNLGVMMSMMDASLIPRMQSLRALTHALAMPVAVYWLLALLIVIALWAAERRQGEQGWLMAGAVLATMLISPYVQTYDLSLGVLAIALAVSCMHVIPDSKRTALMLVAFAPGLAGVAGQVTGRNWPAVPAAVLLLFAYCIYRAGKTEAA
jgi:hypothetical protein